MGKEKGNVAGLGYRGGSSMTNKVSIGKASAGPKIIFVKGKVPFQKGKDKVVPDAPKFQALSSKAPIVTCYYCELKGHMKFKYKKRLNDWKQSQIFRRKKQERKTKEKKLFQKFVFLNLKNKQELEAKKITLQRQVWVKIGNLKMHCLTNQVLTFFF